MIPKFKGGKKQVSNSTEVFIFLKRNAILSIIQLHAPLNLLTDNMAVTKTEWIDLIHSNSVIWWLKYTLQAFNHMSMLTA